MIVIEGERSWLLEEWELGEPRMRRQKRRHERNALGRNREGIRREVVGFVTGGCVITYTDSYACNAPRHSSYYRPRPTALQAFSTASENS